jgi:hypothetical protein
MNMTIQTPQWHALELNGEPQFFVGRRKANRELEAWRLSLHADTFEALREICSGALERIQNMQGVRYSPYAHPELGEEYLIVGGEGGAGSVPEIQQICYEVRDVMPIEADGLAEISTQFYGIVYGEGNDVVGFIRKTNPRRSLNRGNRFFKFRDTLRLVDEPDVVLEEDVDLIVTNDMMAVLRPFSFETLAGEVSFSIDNIREYVAGLAEVLSEKIPLGPHAQQNLEDVARRKVSIVKRLRNVREHLEVADVDSEKLRSALARHELDGHLTFDESGCVSLDETNVELFLDLLEGRYFEQDFTGAGMRADRLRPRLARASGVT